MAPPDTKKRQRLDLLASLDAAFAPAASTPKESKYTSNAAVVASGAAAQQAYLQTKKKKRRNNANGGATKAGNGQQKQDGNSSANKASNATAAATTQTASSRKYDSLYGTLNADSVLSVALKGCSLANGKALGRVQTRSAAFKQFLSMATAGGSEAAALDKLRNKILQVDNPIKTTDAAKQAARQAQTAHAQTTMLLGARRRRQLGLHLLRGDMEYSDAVRLAEIWTRYAKDTFGSDFDDDLTPSARSIRVMTKLRAMDLSGCAIEVVSASNPIHVGLSGIIVAEKQQVLQVCLPTNKLIVLPKALVRGQANISFWKVHGCCAEESAQLDKYIRKLALLIAFATMQQGANTVAPISQAGRRAPDDGGGKAASKPQPAEGTTKRAAVVGTGAAALRTLHAELFQIPRPSAFQVILCIIAYVLLVTDVSRTGSSLDELPFPQIEPNVYSFYGPTILPVLKLEKDGSTVKASNDSLLTVGKFKFGTSSYGMRSILNERTIADWDSCMSAYDEECAKMTADKAFKMLEGMVNTIRLNDLNTTSYKTMGDNTLLAIGVAPNETEPVTREYLATLPQRVRFAVRAKARWIDGASSFLSHYLLDQKYWMSTWATYFDDFNNSAPANQLGMDICLDDLDRPLFCEKSWADFSRLAHAGSDGAKVGKLWDHISDTSKALQLMYPNKRLDMTIIETETDPLTLLGGAVVLAHKLYNVVVIYRVGEGCVSSVVLDATTQRNHTVTECTTTAIHDVRYEGRVLYTDAIEWRYITKTMRYFAQVYNIVRLVFLFLGCYAAVKATRDADSLSMGSRVVQAMQIFFSIPSQVIVYGSFIPVFIYSAAHVIDGVILYHINDDKMNSLHLFFSNNFVDMMQLLGVRMRNVWVVAIIARIFVFIQTSGGWTPAKGVSGIKGYLLPFISFIAIAFVLRDTTFQDSRILETNEVEPAATFMYIRAETLDTWKMNAFGLYNDFLSLALTSVAYVVVVICFQLLRRFLAKKSVGKDSLFFSNSDVPYSAGFLWDPSCLVVCWGSDLFTSFINIFKSGSQGPTTLSDAKNGANGGNTTTHGVSRDVENRYVLMNIAFLSDPWNFLTMKFGHTRIHLFELREMNRKLLHPYSKARFIREYEMKPEDITLLGTFNVSELAWEQLWGANGRKPTMSKVTAVDLSPSTSGTPGKQSNDNPQGTTSRTKRHRGSESLRHLHVEFFDAPMPSIFRIALACYAYLLLVTDVFRGGASLDSLPYTPIEPDVYAFDGPHVAPTITLNREYKKDGITTTAADGTPLNISMYKFDTESFGMRSILALRPEALKWPECITLYDDSCADAVQPATAFDMMEKLVETIKANDVNTTSYKNALAQLFTASGTSAPTNLASNFSLAIDRDELSMLPQRVRFAVRSKARWIDGTSSFLSHYLLDQKYWISTWGTYFNDFNVSSPGMDLCLDDMDRPLFCEKSWADFERLSPPGSAAAKVGNIWEDISNRAAALQVQYPKSTVDLTIIEVETDPVTLVGGAVVIAHKLFNVVAVYRVRDCSVATGGDTICLTTRLDDQRYSGKVLYTNAIEWRYITRTMRYFAQVYLIVRLACLMVACHRSVKATRGFEMKIWYRRLQVAAQLFFAIPCQVVVYGSCIPVFVYAAAHAIDGVILYYLNDAEMNSFHLFFANSFTDMMRLLSVRMRNIWVVAFVARLFVFAQTSGGWTPVNGVIGIKGYLIPFISVIAVAFVVRDSAQQDARILEAHEVEPTISFMNIRADVLDAWKMNAMGLSSDVISLALTTFFYGVALVGYELLRRLIQRSYVGRESLFLTNSDVPYAAGFLWDSSSLVVGWDDDMFTTLHNNLVLDTGTKPVEAPTFRGFYASLARDIETRHVLMNIAFLSDPWNLLTMQFGQTRLYLYEVSPAPNQPHLKRTLSLMHPYAPARFLREYGLAEQQVKILGMFNASELDWEQVILCR
ncbi:TPA: hypothetical protein N0F65_010534 [Lagenidium giganteum]|uniref:Uncharacterized protein n=1 Tax=Lagenidium giganteum TaxID=4803 RepID=A0AAV2Z9M7_9STRA|nr:TPA: hypothetical protein N0F65_010534 [Lagenidium giganteum]